MRILVASSDCHLMPQGPQKLANDADYHQAAGILLGLDYKPAKREEQDTLASLGT